MRCVINSDLTSEKLQLSVIIFLVSVKQTDLFTTADFTKSISFRDKIVGRANSAADHNLQYHPQWVGDDKVHSLKKANVWAYLGGIKLQLCPSPKIILTSCQNVCLLQYFSNLNFLKNLVNKVSDRHNTLASGLKKYLNSTLPIGQATLKFCLSGALPHLPKFSNSLIIHEPKNGSQITGVF